MSTNDERHFLQATYQSILIQVISDVVFRMDNGEFYGAFNALETMYDALPDACQKEVEPTHTNIITQLTNIGVQTQSIDIALRQMSLNYKKSAFLQQACHTLFKEYKKSLERNNYLDITRGRPATVESSIQNIGAKLKQ